MPAIPDKPLLTPAEVIASGVLPICQSTLYEALKRGEIPSVRVGAKWLIPRRWLAELGEVPVAS